MSIQTSLDYLTQQHLDVYFKELQKGLEKESLRIDADGMLALTPHPKSLGAPLTHAHITTDYAEPLLELVTSTYQSTDKVMHQLHDLHSFVYQNIGDESLWVNSMPCLVKDEDSIPIARFGQSNSAKMRETYRMGLGYRYGRIMQIIAGIHFNFSLPDTYWSALSAINGQSVMALKNTHYLAMIRNFHRYAWLVLYLFGASPALCKGFLKQRPATRLKPFDMHSLYSPYATTLRLSDLGYSNQNQSAVDVNYNRLSQVIDGLRHATSTALPSYTEIGVKVDGHYRQLNDSILQIENEFYSVIRPKPIVQPGQRPVAALAQNGIEYIEVRCLDLNPWLPAGIDENTIHFLECFLIFCHLSESPELTKQHWQKLKATRLDLCYQGRDPEFTFAMNGQNQTLRQHAHEIFTSLKEIASFLDNLHGHSLYSKAVETQLHHIESPENLPSSRIISFMQDNEASFYEYAIYQAQQHAQYYQQRKLSEQQQGVFKQQSAESWQNLHDLEQQDTLSFEQYLANYFNQ